MKCPRCKSNLKIYDSTLFEENGDLKLTILFGCENEECNFEFNQEDTLEDYFFKDTRIIEAVKLFDIELKEKYFVVDMTAECEEEEEDFTKEFEIEYNYVTDEVLADRGNIGA